MKKSDEEGSSVGYDCSDRHFVHNQLGLLCSGLVGVVFDEE